MQNLMFMEIKKQARFYEIDSETKAALNHFNILGKLLIHDDLELMIKKDAIFNDSSEIEFIVSNNFLLNESIISGKRHNIQPVFSILGNLKSSSSKVIVSSGNGGVPINILDFSHIQTENCSLFGSTYQFGDFNKNKGKKVLLLTAVEEKKKKKKLSTGPNVGIAVAAVVVVTMIIAVIVFYAIKKIKKLKNLHKQKMLQIVMVLMRKRSIIHYNKRWHKIFNFL